MPSASFHCSTTAHPPSVFSILFVPSTFPADVTRHCPSQKSSSWNTKSASHADSKGGSGEGRRVTESSSPSSTPARGVSCLAHQLQRIESWVISRSIIRIQARFPHDSGARLSRRGPTKRIAPAGEREVRARVIDPGLAPTSSPPFRSYMEKLRPAAGAPARPRGSSLPPRTRSTTPDRITADAARSRPFASLKKPLRLRRGPSPLARSPSAGARAPVQARRRCGAAAPLVAAGAEAAAVGGEDGGCTAP